MCELFYVQYYKKNFRIGVIMMRINLFILMPCFTLVTGTIVSHFQTRTI